MSSVEAEAFFDYETDPISVDLGDIDIDGLKSIVDLDPQTDQAQESEAATNGQIEEEICRPEVDNSAQNPNKDTKNAYMRLSVEQERQLLLRAKMGDMQASDKLVEANRWVVLYLAQRFQQPRVDFDELVQVGNITLWKAIKRKDTYSSMRLSTYAYKAIRWEMIKVVKKSQSIVRTTEGSFEDVYHDELEVDHEAGRAIERVLFRVDIARATTKLSEPEKVALVRRFGLRDKLHVLGHDIAKELDSESSNTRVGYEMFAFRLVNSGINKLREHPRIR